jgi:hypothetical protein
VFHRQIQLQPASETLQWPESFDLDELVKVAIGQFQTVRRKVELPQLYCAQGNVG